MSREAFGTKAEMIGNAAVHMTLVYLSSETMQGDNWNAPGHTHV